MFRCACTGEQKVHLWAGHKQGAENQRQGTWRAQAAGMLQSLQALVGALTSRPAQCIAALPVKVLRRGNPHVGRRPRGLVGS